MASGDCGSGAAGGVIGETVGLFTKARLANWLEERVEDARSGEVTTEQLLQELNEYQDAGVDVARLVSGFAVAVAGGDVDAAALTGGNAAENNALCAGICIGIIAAIAGYVTYLGDGDPLDGLAVFGSGDHPLSHAMAAAVSTTVEWSASKYPDETEAFLGILEVAGDAIDAKIEYLDDATGNKVSQHWNEIPEYTRNQIKGGVGIISIFVPGGSVKALKQLKAAKAGKGKKYDTDRRVCSFHADTLVLTDGGLLPISDVNTNMSVWSRNPANGTMAWKSVLAQYSNRYEETVHVTLRDIETGETQTIISNKIHPFFVQVPQKPKLLHLAATGTISVVPPSSEGHHYQGPIANGHWVDASNLKAGYRLLNDNESWAEVVSVQVEQKELKAYNLTVADFHTYFVRGADNDNAEAVWVHNDCFDAHFPSRNAALRGAKEQAGIPRSQQPKSTYNEILRDPNTKEPQFDSNGQAIRTRNYVYNHPQHGQVVIKEHSAGHPAFKGQPAGKKHFNVERYHGQVGSLPHETSSISGVSGHYTFN